MALGALNGGVGELGSTNATGGIINFTIASVLGDISLKKPLTFILTTPWLNYLCQCQGRAVPSCSPRSTYSCLPTSSEVSRLQGTSSLHGNKVWQECKAQVWRWSGTFCNSEFQKGWCFVFFNSFSYPQLWEASQVFFLFLSFTVW